MHPALPLAASAPCELRNLQLAKVKPTETCSLQWAACDSCALSQRRRQHWSTAFEAPPGRTTTRLTNNALPSDIGLEDAFDGLFDVLENAYTSGAVVDFTSAASAAADTFAAADPVVQAGAAAVALAGGAASVFRPLSPKFPTIYGSWFGDKMSADMRACISAGLRSGLTAMEVRTQALPNLDEAKFGTPTNERFQIECARSLGRCRAGRRSAGPCGNLLGGVEALRNRRDVVSVTASDSHRPQQKGKVDAGGLQKSVKRFDSNYMLVKRDPIAYANVWWAQRIAPALGSRRKIWVLLAEGRVDTSACSKLPRNFVVKPLESKDVQVTSRDAVIVVAPGVTQSWTIGYVSGVKRGRPVVFLNSQLPERYSLGGPLDDVEEVYYLKPISKGFVYRAYPGGWQCILRVEINQCVGEVRTPSTAMNRHRHAIEQASHRWRGGRHAGTRRNI